MASPIPPSGGLYGSGAGPQLVLSGPRPASGGGQGSSADAAEEARRWDEYLAAIQDMLRTEAGSKDRQLRMQYEDAQKGRDNAWRIAQLSADTSRYGTDVGRQNLLDQLKQNQQQFDANHQLERDRFGLDVAKTYAEYGRSYDDIWALQDLKTGVARASQGLSPQPLTANPTRPQPKTWESMAALQGYGSLPAVQEGQVRAGGGSGPVQAGGGQMADTNGDGVPDARIKAMQAVAKAIPPSSGTGLDQQDWAGLAAIQNLWFANKPGAVERLGEERRRAGMAGLQRLGYNANLVESDRINRTRLGQGSSRAA